MTLASCRGQGTGSGEADHKQNESKRPVGATVEEEQAIQALERKNALFLREQETVNGKLVHSYWRVDLSVSTCDVSDLKLLQKIKSIQVVGLNHGTSKALSLLHGITDLRWLIFPSGAKDDELEEIGHFKGLIGLGLRGTSITDKTLNRIKQNSKLEFLELGATAISDNGLKNISELPRLKHLRLAKTSITDEGLKHLGKLTDLVSMELDETSISNAGLKFLSGATALTRISVEETKVTDEGLYYCRLFPKLDWLQVSGEGITDRGLAFLESVPSLRTLHLYGTKVSREGVAKLQKAIPDLGILATPKPK